MELVVPGVSRSSRAPSKIGKRPSFSAPVFAICYFTQRLWIMSKSVVHPGKKKNC